MTLEIAKLMKVPPLYLNSRNFVAVFADIENTAIRICYANKFYSFVLKPWNKMCKSQSKFNIGENLFTFLCFRRCNDGGLVPEEEGGRKSLYLPIP